MAFVSSFLLFSVNISSHNNHTSNLESFGPSLFLLQFNSVALTVYAAGLFMLLKVSRTKFERDVVTNAVRIAEKSTVKVSHEAQNLRVLSLVQSQSSQQC